MSRDLSLWGYLLGLTELYSMTKFQIRPVVYQSFKFDSKLGFEPGRGISKGKTLMIEKMYQNKLNYFIKSGSRDPEVASRRLYSNR